MVTENNNGSDMRDTKSSCASLELKQSLDVLSLKPQIRAKQSFNNNSCYKVVILRDLWQDNVLKYEI